MTIAHVQSATNGASAASASIAATVTAIGAGNLVAGIVTWHSPTTGDFSSVTDNQGNTYTIVDRVTSAANGFNQCLGTFYAANITNAPTTITANFANTPADVGIFLDEYSGAGTTPLDGHAMQTQAAPGTGTDACTSGNITTTVVGDLIYAGMVDVQGASGSDVAGTNFTLRVNNDASNGFSFSSTEDRVQVAAGTAAGTFTLSANVVTITGVMAFTPPTAPPAGPSETYGMQIFRPNQRTWR